MGIKITCDRCGKVVSNSDSVTVVSQLKASELLRLSYRYINQILCTDCKLVVSPTETSEKETITPPVEVKLPIGEKTEVEPSVVEKDKGSADEDIFHKRKSRVKITPELTVAIQADLKEHKLTRAQIAQKHNVSYSVVNRLAVAIPPAPVSEGTPFSDVYSDAMAKAKECYPNGGVGYYYHIFTELYIHKGVSAEDIRAHMLDSARLFDKWLGVRQRNAALAAQKDLCCDVGKVLALTHAGWSPAKIADDMHKDINVIEYVLAHEQEYADQLRAQDAFSIFSTNDDKEGE